MNVWRKAQWWNTWSFSRHALADSKVKVRHLYFTVGTCETECKRFRRDEKRYECNSSVKIKPYTELVGSWIIQRVSPGSKDTYWLTANNKQLKYRHTSTFPFTLISHLWTYHHSQVSSPEECKWYITHADYISDYCHLVHILQAGFT